MLKQLLKQLWGLRPSTAASGDRFEDWFYRGNALRAEGRFESAIEAMEAAVRLNSGYAGARSNLALLLLESGRVSEAEVILRGLAAGTDDKSRDAHDNLLLTLGYREDLTPQAYFAEHRRWAERHADPLTASAVAPVRPADPERPLNIGYVSPDFCMHPVALFLLPLLQYHDRQRYRVHCYATRKRDDHITARLRGEAQVWKSIASASDEEAAQLIRNDGIDVLVDLAGHTSWNRLPVFARRPAPVQVSWLGYLNTTGMRAMNARLTDGIAAPAEFDEFHSERVVRLPSCQWCFQPLVEMPDVAPSPVRRTGRLTFGSFHNLAKVGPGVVKLWSRLLAQIPNSRLLVMAKGLADGGQGLGARFTAEGVAIDRVKLLNAAPYREYLAAYSDVDIVLDTFPYSGGTTTCEALWMGVPVVTWTCPTVAGRGAASLLTAAGLPDLIAASPEAYLSLAATLAADRPRLEQLRATLRARLQASALMDPRRFATDVESAFRDLWRTWCAGR